MCMRTRVIACIQRTMSQFLRMLMGVCNAAAAFSSQKVNFGEHHVPVNIKALGGDCHNAGFVVLVLVLHGGTAEAWHRQGTHTA